MKRYETPQYKVLANFPEPAEPIESKVPERPKLDSEYDVSYDFGTGSIKDKPKDKPDIGTLSDDDFKKLWNKTLSDRANKASGKVGEVKEKVIDSGLGFDETPKIPVSGEEMRKGIGKGLIHHEDEDVGGDSVLGRIVDVLSRGEYGSASIAKDYVLGRPMTEESMKKAFKEGFAGRRKETYSDLIDMIKPEWSKPKRFALGLALSIFADPTTYVPMGFLGKSFQVGGKELPGAVGLVGKIPGVKEGVTKLKKSVIGDVFIPGNKLPKDYYESKYYAGKGLEAEEQRIFRQVEKLRSGLSKADMEKLTYYRQHPDKIHEMPQHLTQKLEDIANIFEGYVTKAEEAGIISKDVATRWRGDKTYLPGYYPGRGLKLTKGTIVPSLFEKAQKPSWMKKKQFETLDDAVQFSNKFKMIEEAKTIEEANGLMKSFGLEEAFGKVSNLDIKDIRKYAGQMKDLYYPELNPIKMAVYRGIDNARTIARRKFIDNTLEEFGTQIKAGTKIVPEGYRVYLPKGAIRMYVTEMLDPKLRDVLDEFAAKVQDIKIKTEKVETIKTTTKTTGKLAESGPAAQMESVVRNALEGRGMTAAEANVYISKIKSGGKGAVDDVVEEITEKAEQIRTVLDSKGLEDDLIDISNLSEDFMKKMVGVTSKVKTYALPKDIANDLNYSAKLVGGNPAFAKMLGMFDKVQNYWKGFATALRVPFHIRNMYSNWWLASLAGVKDPMRFSKAAAIQLSYLFKTTGNIEIGNKVFDLKELRTTINELGIRGRGWFGADIDAKLIDELDSLVKYGKLRKLTPMRLGRSFGTAIEDNARIAVFIDQLSKGKSMKEASQQVRKYLFDYEELTDVEKKVMKRIWPFYTWTRKNAPLQVESLLEQPRKFQIYAKSLRAFDEDLSTEEKMAKPEYFNKLMYIKSPFKSEMGKPLYMSVDVPPMEFNKVLDGYQWLSSATPWKLIPELIYNVKMFPQPSEIGKPRELIRAPYWVAWLPKPMLNLMHKHSYVDRLYNKEKGEYELGINKTLLHAVHTALPFLAEQSRIHAEPISLEDEEPENKRKAYRTGIGFKNVDIVKGAAVKEYRMNRMEKNVETFVEQRHRMPTKEEFKALTSGE